MRGSVYVKKAWNIREKKKESRYQQKDEGTKKGYVYIFPGVLVTRIPAGIHTLMEPTITDE